MNAPQGWAGATLADVAKWGSGGTPKATEPTYYGGNIPWAIIGDLNDSIVTSCANSITASGLENSSAKVVSPGTILVAMYGSIGKLGIAGMDMATNQAIAFARPYEEVIAPRYLFWYLRFQRDALLRSGKGATQQNISQTILKAWPIPLAPLAEQQRIVEVIEEQVSRLDAAEASLDCADRRLRTLRGATFWGLADQPETEWANIGEVAEVRGGIQKQPKRRPDKNPYPFLRVANVGRGTLDLNEVHQVELFSSEIERYRLQTGDLLVVEGNGSADQIGRSAMWYGEIANCVHQNHLIRVRPTSRIDPRFLEAFWNAPQTIALLSRLASSTSGLHTLSTTKVKSIRIPLLPIEIQKNLVTELDRQLSIFEETTSEIDHARRRSKQLRRAILEHAFSGRLVSQPDGGSSVSSASIVLDVDRATAVRSKRNGAAPLVPKSEVMA